MANSSNYIVQTRNRCVVGVYGDTAGTISFGITNSAFDAANIDARITNSSASLSKIMYGMSGSSTAVILGFGSTSSTAGATGVAFLLTTGTNQLDFERFTIPNGVTNSPNGNFYVTIPASTTVTAYLEFVPF